MKYELRRQLPRLRAIAPPLVCAGLDGSPWRPHKPSTPLIVIKCYCDARMPSIIENSHHKSLNVLTFYCYARLSETVLRKLQCLEILCAASCTKPGASSRTVFITCDGRFFAVASLLNCLQQLRQENLHLEEHINMLTSRRDQLLAVNARLGHAPVVTNSLAPGLAGGHLSTAARGLGLHGRTPRVNNAVAHVDSNNTQVGLESGLFIYVLYLFFMFYVR